jgi:hypothetical protein
MGEHKSHNRAQSGTVAGRRAFRGDDSLEA